jgi:hypothetical protein
VVILIVMRAVKRVMNRVVMPFEWRFGGGMSVRH